MSVPIKLILNPFTGEEQTVYNLDRSRPREIARTNLANNEDLLTSAGNHTKAITDILDGTASDEEKQNEIRKLNQQYMQQLEPLLRYTDKENKTQSLDLEMDSGGNIIVVDGGKTYTIVDTVTGNVNINQLQDLINQKQAPVGARTGGGKKRMADY